MRKLSFVIIIFLFSIQFARSEQFKIWTDEEDVTHIEIEDYKPKKKTYYESEPKYIEKYQQKTIPKKRVKKNIDQEWEKKKKESELKRAKENYEFYKSREQWYRKQYHESNDRDYWEAQLKKVKEAEKKYYKLKTQY